MYTNKERHIHTRELILIVPSWTSSLPPSSSFYCYNRIKYIEERLLYDNDVIIYKILLFVFLLAVSVPPCRYVTYLVVLTRSHSIARTVSFSFFSTRTRVYPRGFYNILFPIPVWFRVVPCRSSSSPAPRTVTRSYVRTCILYFFPSKLLSLQRRFSFASPPPPPWRPVEAPGHGYSHWPRTETASL